MEDVGAPMTEWRDLPGAEDYYSVSDDGRVVSKARLVRRGNVLQPRKSRLLKGHVAMGGYQRVKICIPGEKYRMWFIHELVMLAFVGPKPEGMDTRHLNGDPQDNRLVNLAYGTRRENIDDKVRHGKPYQVSAHACPNGHDYTVENTKLVTSKDGRVQRNCRTCLRDKWARARETTKRKMVVTHG